MKLIPIRLHSHLKEYATTWCYIMRVECVGRYAGVVRGFSGLDWPIRYDDGQGEVLYKSDNGFMPAQFQRQADFGVDNTDIVGWVTDEEISEQDILAGIFSSAKVTIYRVNYMDLDAGHEVVDYGTFGETEFNENRWKCEFRSLMQQAKQPFTEVYSLTCRNQYGDQKCKMPFEWFTATVTEIGEDEMLMVVAPELTQGSGYFVPGVMEVLTGANAGADMDIDEFLTGGYIRLALPMPLPFQVGDEFRIRRDCDKLFTTCQDRGNVLEFRGEHLTPVADTGLQVPGAYVNREN